MQSFEQLLHVLIYLCRMKEEPSFYTRATRRARGAPPFEAARSRRRQRRGGSAQSVRRRPLSPGRAKASDPLPTPPEGFAASLLPRSVGLRIKGALPEG